MHFSKTWRSKAGTKSYIELVTSIESAESENDELEEVGESESELPSSEDWSTLREIDVPSVSSLDNTSTLIGVPQ
jgi:hypothetical protein